MEKMRSYSALFIINSDREATFDGVKKEIGAIIGENSGNVMEEKIIGKKAQHTRSRKDRKGSITKWFSPQNLQPWKNW